MPFLSFYLLLCTSLAGKPAVFKCKINEIKENQKPELDDEFAKDVSEFDTIAELKADIEKKMVEEKTANADNAFQERVMDKVIEGMEAEIPDAMVDTQVERIAEDFSYRLAMQGMDFDTYLKMTGMDMDGFRKVFAPQALRQVKIRLALEKVAELEGMDVTEEDLNAEFEKLAENIYISKPLTLCGADRHTTIIKGSKATDDPSLNATARKLGLGSDAVRCIGINASDVVISNFTITGGATHRAPGWTDTDAVGGGVFVFSGKTGTVLSDCIISNNVARRGGAVSHGTYTGPSLTVVRSWIHGNFAENDEPVARGSLLAFCLVTGHPHNQEPITDGSVLVNCTFAGNRMRSLIKSASAKAYNCLFADEWYKADDPATTNSFCYANCAFPIGVEMFLTPGLTNNACIFSAGLDHFVSPIDNDYRLHQGAANAIDKGDAAFLQEIPQQYRYRDFSGAEISENAATVSLGCLQEIVLEVGGTVRFSVPTLNPNGCAAFDYNPTNAFLFGEKNVSFAISGLAYARGVSARGIVRVRCSSSDWKGLYGFSASGSDTVMRYPLMDGTYEIMIPPAGKTLTLSPALHRRGH